MNILVTGGKGTIGRPLIEHLRSRGHQVWACDLMHGDEDNYFRCDVSKYRQLQEIFQKYRFDYVFHLAAEFGRWNGEEFYENLWLTNVVGMKHLLLLQAEYGFKMIFPGSSEVYGDYDQIMHEDVLDRLGIKQMNDYAISKWANELQILNIPENWGNEIVRVRIFNTYGPGEYYTPYRSAICIFTYKALHDLPYTVYLEHLRSSLYIDDCLTALANIVDHFVPGEVYNIAGAELHDMKKVSDMILAYLGKDDSKVTYVKQEKLAARVKKPDIAKAKRDLHYTPSVFLKNGIPETIEWMKKAYGRIG